MKYKNYTVDLTFGLTLRDSKDNLILWINDSSMNIEMRAKAKAGNIEEVLKIYKSILDVQNKQLNCILFDRHN